jgi:Flp pilus assembly protein TadG
MKCFHDQRGEMAEAAITTPVVILLMLAIINLGMVVFAQQAAQNAANYGARIGSVAQDAPAARAAAAARQAAQHTMIGNYSVAVLAPGGVAGQTLAIEVRYTVPNFFGGLGALYPGLPDGPFAGRARALFRQEGW